MTIDITEPEDSAYLETALTIEAAQLEVITDRAEVLRIVDDIMWISRQMKPREAE